MAALAIVLFISYLLGSIPSSVWVGKLFKGMDVRNHGSGNAGATNTFRVLGWKSGVVVVIIDFMKGFTSTFWVSKMAHTITEAGPISPPGWELDAFLQIACGVFAMIGHMYPVFASFNGGKGVLTACGMLYGIEPVSISISLGLFLIIMFSTRYVSLASITASISYPLGLLTLRHYFGWDIDGSIILLGAAAALGIVIKHRSNIRRLLNGSENRVSSFRPSEGKKQEKVAEVHP